MAATDSMDNRADTSWGVKDRVTALVLGYLCYSTYLLQVGVVALLVKTAKTFQLSIAEVSWVLTIELLVGAVAFAWMTRLGDLYGKRRLMLIGLAVALLGAVICALAPTFAILLVGRALMGAQMPLLQMPAATARDTMPPARARRTIVITHVMTTWGVASGIAVGGLAGTANLGIGVFFWIAAGILVLGLLGVWAVVPESPTPEQGRFDLIGGVLLAIGLVALLLGLSSGGTAGWSAPRTVALLAGGVVALAAWWLVESRVAEPLVNTASLRERAVWGPNLATFLVAFGVYGAISAVAQFSQASPARVGYGFGFDGPHTALYAIPTALGALLAASPLRRLGGRIGYDVTLRIGAALCICAYLVFATGNASVIAFMIGVGIYAMGNLACYTSAQIVLLEQVGPERSGVTTGVLGITSAVGNSVGSAAVGAILAGSVNAATRSPEASGYTTAFAACAVAVAAALAVSVMYVRTTR
ncbi:MFS transporter [Pseudonocardia acaciae]|uniref:MFS transporter n=1 Tax=Pseudonocardia acaciae TaxID=551276 RepID=UPI00048B10BF|nr:MFS transporter [Pseudonocardia acaciae]